MSSYGLMVLSITYKAWAITLKYKAERQLVNDITLPTRFIALLAALLSALFSSS
jgi:hypothetical protein